MRHERQRPYVVACLLAAMLTNGCTHTAHFWKCNAPLIPDEAQAEMPRELCKTSLPDYRVEPPDILVVEAIKIVPKAPYRIEPLDVVQIQVIGALPDQPILGNYQVDASGNVNLGPPYGTVHVATLTIEESQEAVKAHLEKLLQTVVVSISLGESGARQQIEGEHLVGPDGKIRLGTYGGVYVSGLTLDEAKAAIEKHLEQFLEDPDISVDVYAYNSKVYYVIQQGAGQGDGLQRFAVTGNETVLDALAQVNGLASISSKRVWIARPAPHGQGEQQILPVEWNAITQGASTTTNYQVMPGDRIYIAEDKWIAFNAWVTKVTTPFEQIFGFTLLGGQVVRANKTYSIRGGGSGLFVPGGGFF